VARKRTLTAKISGKFAVLSRLMVMVFKGGVSSLFLIFKEKFHPQNTFDFTLFQQIFQTKLEGFKTLETPQP
jgi:hypothetical protein